MFRDAIETKNKSRKGLKKKSIKIMMNKLD